MVVSEINEKISINENEIFEKITKINSNPQEAIKKFLEDQCAKFNLGEVEYTNEDPYYDLEPVFIITNSKKIPFERIDSIWDEITKNTELFSEDSDDEELTEFFHQCFIILE